MFTRVLPRSVICFLCCILAFEPYVVYNQIKLAVTGQSSDSEDLPAMDSSSNCTPVKRLSLPKPQKLPRSPARISPHIKDGEKEKQREKHPNSSPRTYKWSFQLSKGLPECPNVHYGVGSVLRCQFEVILGTINTLCSHSKSVVITCM